MSEIADVVVVSLAAAGMELKTLLYSRLLSQPLPHNTQRHLPPLSDKSLVYSRVERSASSHLEGTSFESNFRSFPCKL